MPPRWTLALLVAAAPACNRDAERPPAPAVGAAERGPVTDLDGASVDPLAPDGRPDVLVFLRTDCPISNRYAPTLGRLGKSLAERGVDLWLVYVDPDETPDVIRGHMKEYGLPGRALRDPTQHLAAQLGITVTPEVSLHDGRGARKYRGRIDDWFVDYGKPRPGPTSHDLRDAVDAVLRGEAPATAETKAVGCPLPPVEGAAPPPPAGPPPLPGADGTVPDAVTFTEHVGPLVHGKCATCHRPDQVAPFSLLTEADVRDHGEQIVDVTGDRFMPPWKPVRGHGEFMGDRSLNDAQIEIFARWVKAGMPTGPESARTAPPTFPAGWQRGTPDVIVELPEAYTVPAEGTDIYRNFVLPASVDRKAWVRGWELDPGNPRVVHHAIVSVDRTGWASRADAADPGPGFEAMELEGAQSPGGFYLVWAPGSSSSEALPGTAWSLTPRTNLILQLHLQPTGKPEPVKPRIGLFLGERPTRAQLTLRVEDVPLDIPPGARDYVAENRLELAADVDLLSVFPHAHYLGKTFLSWAALPDGSERKLLKIDDWDFSWQDQYRYAKPVRLPAGTVIHMRITYDNSAANPRNPANPPRRVVLGPNTDDEMGNLTFEVAPLDREGLLALREDKYRRALSRTDNETGHYNLANVLRDRGNLEGAVAEYRAALARAPEHVWSLHNLSMVLQQLGRHGEAVDAARREVAAAPDIPAAHNNLGNALKGQGKRDEAVTAFRRALELDPGFELARNALWALGEAP